MKDTITAIQVTAVKAIIKTGGGALIDYDRYTGINIIPSNILEDDYLNICTIPKAEASH